MDRAQRLCVYCGSSVGNSPVFAESAATLGEAIVTRELDLVYGGGHVGLMGIVANAVLDGGRPVTGVTTEHLLDREVAHQGVTELVVTPDMQSRKRTMFDRSDAFVALPGGVGTMEELFEVLCWRYLGLHPKPVGLLNIDGFYDQLLGFLDRSTGDGFIRHQHLVVSRDPDELLDELLEPAA
jgi:uncharacterized protein (TIGR00730 family)